MKAFHNDQAIKDKYISRLKLHREADELVKEIGWEKGKGCAVGCTLEGYDHKRYEVELGIPEWLARVEDCIFEGLENEKAMFWPEEFLLAINPGSDLSKIEAPFVIFILESNLNNFDHKLFPYVKKAIDVCIDLYKIGNLNPSAAWSAARSGAASAAASAAWYGTKSAAESAAESAARSAAWSAARSGAASAAASAAWYGTKSAAESAAESAARSGVLYGAESAPEYAARSAYATEYATYDKFAQKLLELLRECK